MQAFSNRVFLSFFFSAMSIFGHPSTYCEIRIDNALEDAQGRKVKLKEGAEVDVTIEADPKDTAPKETSSK